MKSQTLPFPPDFSSDNVGGLTLADDFPIVPRGTRRIAENLESHVAGRLGLAIEFRAERRTQAKVQELAARQGVIELYWMRSVIRFCLQRTGSRGRRPADR